MRKFRKIWMVFFAIMTLLFAVYRFMEIKKSDSSGPVIFVGKELVEMSIYDGEEMLLEGVTAVDKKDGDVTSSVIIENISKFYKDNIRTVTYAAFDSDNHISKAIKEVRYTDYKGPRFELSGSLRFRAGEVVNIEKIVSASDCLDGDLSNKIKITTDTSINNRVTGFYTIKYEVTNSAGDNVVLPIDIEIYEPVNNEVELNLDRYLVYYEGEEIKYKDFLQSVRQGSLEYSFENTATGGTNELDDTVEDAEEAGMVSTSEKLSKSLVRVNDEEVNTEKPGVYPVYYYFELDEGRYTSTAIEVLYVVVE